MRTLYEIGELRLDAETAAARGALGNDAAFDRAWQEGRAMTMEQAIDFALPQKVEPV